MVQRVIRSILHVGTIKLFLVISDVTKAMVYVILSVG